MVNHFGISCLDYLPHKNENRSMGGWLIAKPAVAAQREKNGEKKKNKSDDEMKSAYCFAIF